MVRLGFSEALSFKQVGGSTTVPIKSMTCISRDLVDGTPIAPEQSVGEPSERVLGSAVGAVRVAGSFPQVKGSNSGSSNSPQVLVGATPEGPSSLHGAPGAGTLGTEGSALGATVGSGSPFQVTSSNTVFNSTMDNFPTGLAGASPFTPEAPLGAPSGGHGGTNARTPGAKSGLSTDSIPLHPNITSRRVSHAFEENFMGLESSKELLNDNGFVYSKVTSTEFGSRDYIKENIAGRSNANMVPNRQSKEMARAGSKLWADYDEESEEDDVSEASGDATDF